MMQMNMTQKKLLCHTLLIRTIRQIKSLHTILTLSITEDDAVRLEIKSNAFPTGWNISPK